MPTLNQEAPPATAPKSEYVRLPPFPKSDSYVLTVVAFNFIKDHPFERTDDDGKDYVKNQDAVELYLGTLIDGKPYFTKTWPQPYSLHERANYQKWYTAITGKPAGAGSNVKDLVGGFALVEVEVKQKTTAKGTTYTASAPKTIGKVPSVLAGTGTPIDKLRPALDEILAKKEDDKPF